MTAHFYPLNPRFYSLYVGAPTLQAGTGIGQDQWRGKLTEHRPAGLPATNRRRSHPSAMRTACR
jgi:hypothetical protein